MSQCTGPVNGTCPRATLIRLLVVRPCAGCPPSQQHFGDYAASDAGDEANTVRKG